VADRVSRSPTAVRAPDRHRDRLPNAAYYPRLGGNAVGRPLGPLDFYLFSFPTHPSWLYGLTQGLHVTIGLAVVPILLAKLWSVIPKLFEWPPTRSPAHALERLSLALLVDGALCLSMTCRSPASRGGRHPALDWRSTTGPGPIGRRARQLHGHDPLGHQLRVDRATLGSEQTSDQRALLALEVNGGDLSLDHGYPARVIGPAIPGVHCTKWAHTMIFEAV